MNLAAELDQVHKSTDKTGTAERCASQLEEEQLGLLCAIYISALVRSVPVEITARRVTFGNFFVQFKRKLEQLDGENPIFLATFDITGIELKTDDGPKDVAGMLLILQFARDHSDSMLFSPAELRLERLSNLAERSGSSVKFAQFLIGNYPAIARIAQL